MVFDQIFLPNLLDVFWDMRTRVSTPSHASSKTDTIYKKYCHYPCTDSILSGTGEFLKTKLRGKLPVVFILVSS